MPKFEFNVLHYDINRKKIEMWNIFNNIHVNDKAHELAEQFIGNEISYEELRDGLDKAIMCQEWSRYEYELSAGEPFCSDPNKLVKLDAYYQAHANIDLITKMVIDKMFEDLYHLDRY